MPNRNAYQRKRTQKMTCPKEVQERHPVRVFRKSYGLSQEQLGQILGVSGTAVGFWERGVCKAPNWALEIIESPDDYLLKAIKRVKEAEKCSPPPSCTS